MFGSTFSGPHGELFTVLIDPRSDSFVIQLDAPDDGPPYRGRRRTGGARPAVNTRDDDGPLAEVRQLPRGRVVDVLGSKDDNAG